MLAQDVNERIIQAGCVLHGCLPGKNVSRGRILTSQGNRGEHPSLLSVNQDYLNGSARRAETVFGWSRRTVILGLNELRSGIRCLEHFSARGHRKTEAKRPQLAEDIRCLAAPDSQVDPKFQSPFQYTRMTAHAMRQALV